MKTETLGRLIMAIRDARKVTHEVITGFDALSNSDRQTGQIREWCAKQTEESQQVLVELDDHLKGLIKAYWENVSSKD